MKIKIFFKESYVRERTVSRNINSRSSLPLLGFAVKLVPTYIVVFDGSSLCLNPGRGIESLFFSQEFRNQT